MLLASLSYEMHLPARATGREPTVCLLGPLGSTRSLWSPQSRALSERFRVLAVDHRGHGGSELVEGPASMDALAGDVVSVLDSIGIDSVHLVGSSLGGAVAQHIAIHRPERADSLTLLGSPPRFAEPEKFHEWAAAARERGVAALAGPIAEGWLSRRFAELNPEILSRLRSMIAATPAEGFAAACEALAGFDARSGLAGVDVPVLAIAGDEDAVAGPDAARAIVDAVGHGAVEIIAPAGHVPAVEHPAQVSTIVAEHVRGAV